jgi:hypothetical protein
MIYRELVVMDANPTPKARKWIATCVAEKTCVCGCGQVETTLPFKRGLAPSCYYEWRTTRAALGNETKRVAFDCSLIRRGKLLIAQASRKLKSESVFTKAAAEVG